MQTFTMFCNGRVANDPFWLVHRCQNVDKIKVCNSVITGEGLIGVVVVANYSV